MVVGPPNETAAHGLGADVRSFSDAERAVLLLTPRIGPGVIERLERAGIHSLDMLRSLGIDEALQRIAEDSRAMGLANRRRALAAALGTSLPLASAHQRTASVMASVERETAGRFRSVRQSAGARE